MGGLIEVLTPEQEAAISVPAGFRFNQVLPGPPRELPESPSLGPLAAFVGTWQGNGFNTIFRPNNPDTPTTGFPVDPTDGVTDNVLELNLTRESLAFSPSLGSVPNRGLIEADAFLNGVPYLQTVSDITSGEPIGLHVEPGLWMCVPPTSEESEQTLVRMGSIPHGTTILAQGTSREFAGPPDIPIAPITPFRTGSGPPVGPFPSQDAANNTTHRIPQDLTMVPGGTITAAMLVDPNTLLREHNNGLNILSTTEISISTAPTSPLFGGGTDNIAFLLGSPAAENDPLSGGENAQTLQMSATFWIETVEHTITIPLAGRHEPPLMLTPEPTHPTLPLPIFTGTPPEETLPPGRVIRLQATQIQYSQTVLLNFNGLIWPHVSVATLAPAGAILIV